MILLPHLYILQYLKNQMAFLRSKPEHLEFLLGAYGLNDEMNGIYGAPYIDRAIKWISENEFHYTLGYRLDIDKLPNICVTYEGGSEERQFIGDYADTEKVSIKPKIYASFDIKSIDANGDLVVSKDLNLLNSIWRRLIVKNNKFKSQIIDFQTNDDDDLVIVLDKKAPKDVPLVNWKAQSPLESKNLVIGSSFDRVKISIYVSLSGDPELSELISSVIRYLLKQSRMYLIQNGLEDISFSHTAISRSADFPESNVWITQHAINGSLQDRWIITESKGADRLELTVKARLKTEDDTVIVYDQEPI
jgi:hypothetical protein